MCVFVAFFVRLMLRVCVDGAVRCVALRASRYKLHVLKFEGSYKEGLTELLKQYVLCRFCCMCVERISDSVSDMRVCGV
jgi:hypothetical protein